MGISCTAIGMILVALLLFGMSAAWAEADPVQIARGEQVYTEKKCGFCHAIRGGGGKLGPDLSGVGAKRDEQWLKGFMKEPKAMNPKAKMLPFKGSDEELEALVAYMTSLQ
jgi:mono/diheme cytochrome c family protein